MSDQADTEPARARAEGPQAAGVGRPQPLYETVGEAAEPITEEHERARPPRLRARLAAGVRRALRSPWAPRVALILVLAFSVAGKAIDISQPCTAPCKASSKPTLIFDEDYYVNAARVIDHINPPAKQPYHGAPLGKDPNAEHPQLAKLAIAAGIKIFGDVPLGWRAGSILFAAIALLALYALVRGAGGSAWLAVGTAAVFSLDNLMLVHGRIGTLDIYAVAMMLVAAAFYVRKRPLLAGIALGVAACMKEVALFLVFVLVLLEALRVLRVFFGGQEWGRATVAQSARRGLHAAGAAAARRAVPLGLFLAAGALSFLGLLWLLDVLVPAYDPGTHTLYAGNPFSHIAHMYSYALLLKSKPNEAGIASGPLAWLLDEKTINYASVVVKTTSAGKLLSSYTPIAFRGAMNPFIIFLAIPATFAALWAGWTRGDRVAALGACWCLGTYLPFLFGNLISGRVSYIYYMLIVMPGVYIVTAKLFADRRMPRAAAIGWAVALVYGFIHLYPLRTLL